MSAAAPSSARRPGVLVALALTATALVLGGCGGSSSSGEGASTANGAEAATTPGAGASRSQFVGMVASEVLPLPQAQQEQVLRAQAAAGVTTLRQTFLWSEIEPHRGVFAWGMHDQLVASAAKAGITMMPIVFGISPGEGAKAAPGAHVTGTTTMPPKDDAHFAAYARLLVQRYGAGGSFWRAHPELPAHPPTAWQIWNEPNLPPYWGGKVSPSGYADLLVATAAAIRKVDPKAEIVTGGIPDSRLGMPLSRFVRILAQSSAKGSFDTLAVHPYAKNVSGVLGGVRLAKAALDQFGLRNVSLRITEVGWATGSIGSDFTVTQERQAELVAELLQRTSVAARELRLRGVIYYGWRDVAPPRGTPDFWGLHTGLMTQSNRPKPALAAFTAAAKAAARGQ